LQGSKSVRVMVNYADLIPAPSPTEISYAHV
jgi:hypothetical protein